MLGAFALGAVVLLAGCAAPASPGAAPAPDTVVRVAGVPFVAQPDWQCGPASLAMAMAAAGRPIDVDTLARASFVPGREGSLQPELLAAARRHGLLATVLPARTDALVGELAAGRPVIVLQNLGLAWWPRWHYAVVVGLDVPAGEIELHSGDTPSVRMSRRTCEHTWARSGRWAIAVTAPEVLPASAGVGAVLASVAALERVDPSAAAPAWESVVVRWPEDRLARFGRANARLARGEARGAADGFREAIAIDPGFADAWNNLARALAAAGETEAARAAADRALALGGPHVEAYRDTRAALGH